jgi:TATA-box binding protein (TBP) (component of TFIID and TFIIIB)
MKYPRIVEKTNYKPNQSLCRVMRVVASRRKITILATSIIVISKTKSCQKLSSSMRHICKPDLNVYVN